MKRLAMLSILALGIGACGSDSNTPSVSQVTVTVRQGGGPVVGTPVQVSTAANSRSDLGTILDSANTDTSGQASFSVPSSTSTGSLCFSSLITSSTGGSFKAECHTLNALTATVLLDHDAP
jgi:hypothetical protein